MTISGDNKVFISWSGTASKDIALFFKTWIEAVVDNVSVWVSDTDISPGSRSMKEIEDSLRDSKMGIIVTTRANMGKDWINFEAGALSQEVANRPGRVIPLLVDFDSPSELVGPLSVFQAVVLTKARIAQLLSAVYVAIGSPDRSAAKIDRYWQDVEAMIPEWRARVADGSDSIANSSRPLDELTSEILGIVRELRDSSPPRSDKNDMDSFPPSRITSRGDSLTIMGSTVERLDVLGDRLSGGLNLSPKDRRIRAFGMALTLLDMLANEALFTKRGDGYVRIEDF